MSYRVTGGRIDSTGSQSSEPGIIVRSPLIEHDGEHRHPSIGASVLTLASDPNAAAFYRAIEASEPPTHRLGVTDVPFSVPAADDKTLTSLQAAQGRVPYSAGIG